MNNPTKSVSAFMRFAIVALFACVALNCSLHASEPKFNIPNTTQVMVIDKVTYRDNTQIGQLTYRYLQDDGTWSKQAMSPIDFDTCRWIPSKGQVCVVEVQNGILHPHFLTARVTKLAKELIEKSTPRSTLISQILKGEKEG